MDKKRDRQRQALTAERSAVDRSPIAARSPDRGAVSCLQNHSLPVARTVGGDVYCRAMANTYTQLYFHLVFAVQWRQCVIPPDHKEEFYKYIAGIVKGEQQKLMVINGMPDHVHLLVGFGPECVPSDFVKKVKAASARLFNDKGWVARKFNWQRGYGAFSCSRSDVPKVARGIEEQEAYHATHSFNEEFIALLEETSSMIRN